MPHIVSIVYTPAGIERKPDDRFARQALERATLIADHGIDGDLKAAGGKRQLNVMLAGIVAQLATEGRLTKPGELGEQIVIAGLDNADLQAGARLRLGATAEIIVNIPRTGCARFEHIQGATKESVAGRLGVMASVLVGGPIAVGDEVCLASSQ